MSWSVYCDEFGYFTGDVDAPWSLLESDAFPMSEEQARSVSQSFSKMCPERVYEAVVKA